MKAEDKHIEALIDKLMTSDALEKPSFDFTETVMSKIDALETTSSVVYKPLISKKAWLTIGIAAIVLIGFFVFNQRTEGGSLLDKYNLAFEFKNPLEHLNFNFSKTMVYAVGLLAVMLFIQIPVLKHYFNKSTSV